MKHASVTYWFCICVKINGTEYAMFRPAACLVPVGSTVWLDDGDETQWSFPEPFRVEAITFYEKTNSFDIDLGEVDVGDCPDGDDYQLEGLRSLGWVGKNERHIKRIETTEFARWTAKSFDSASATTSPAVADADTATNARCGSQRLPPSEIL